MDIRRGSKDNCGMKTRRVTFSFTCCLTVLVCVFFYIDIHIRPRSTNAHLHLYYSYSTNRSGFRTLPDTTRHKINFISISNCSSVLSYQTTTFSYDDDNVTRMLPDFPTTAAATASGSRAHIIAIVSYMRSGSTLTADILQHFPGAMYVFEPFHSLVLRSRKGLPLKYLDGTVKWLLPENITNDLLQSELKKWFECRFEDLDLHSLTDGFHASYSRSMRPFFRCTHQKPQTMKTVRKCLPLAKEMCKNAKYRLFKFIRLPMRVVKSVIDIYPKLQIIHLIRDPRGSLSSQIKVNNFTWDRIGSLSQHFCERVADDINSTIYLNYFYPERAKILLYEKLAENPLTTAEKVHNFTNMPHKNYVMKYITKLTMGGRKKGSEYGSQRPNSTKAAYLWRDNINFEHVQTIDTNCVDQYNFIGYRRYSSAEDVKNHSLLTLETPNSPLFI